MRRPLVTTRNEIRFTELSESDVSGQLNARGKEEVLEVAKCKDLTK